MIFRKAAVVLVVVVALTAATAQGDKEYELKEHYAKGDVFTIDARNNMAIDLTVTGAGTARKLPVKFKSSNKYVEKVLEVGEDSRPVKVVRRYDKSTQDTEEPGGKRRSGATSFDGNTYIIERTKDGAKADCPDGKKVTDREQKELGVAVRGNLHKLLPEKPVRPGDTWDVPLDTIREIHSIDSDIKGTAKALFESVDEYGGSESVIIKLRIDIEVPQGAMTMNYKGVGKAYFALETRRMVCIDSTALIEVKGSQKTAQGELEFGGGGSARSSYKVSPGKGEINLKPPDDKKKEEENEKDETKQPSPEDEEK